MSSLLFFPVFRFCFILDIISKLSKWLKRAPSSVVWENNWRTVVSAYIPPGYNPTSASVLLKEFPYCFCYPLHSKVSLFSPTGYKHKPASVLQNFPPPKHAKNPFVNRLLNIICQNLSIECNEPQMNIFQSLSTPHRKIPELSLACITCVTIWFVGKEVQRYRNSAPRAWRLISYIKTMFSS